MKEKLIPDQINKYFYHGITKIENYMLSLYLYCAMNIHIYIFGPSGIGKTAGSECLARIRKQIENLNSDYKKHAFNSSTNPSDILGAETVVDDQAKLKIKIFYENGKIIKNILIDGPLTESALKGQTFIADEMNLSSNSTMMSLIPIFNTIHNIPIYFQGFQTPIKINQNFLFGAFQNYERTAGRNAIPHELTLKLVCLNIRNSIYNNKKLDSKDISIFDDQVLQLADFMIKLNIKRDDDNLFAAEAWSIRNLENIIWLNNKNVENLTYKYITYENCELYINVIFYVLSYIYFESIDGSFDQVI